MSAYDTITRLESHGVAVDYVDAERDATTGTLNYTDYNVTVTRGDKTHNVARLTMYPNGGALVFADVNKDRLQTTRKAWNMVLNTLGYPDNDYERYAARTMAVTQ